MSAKINDIERMDSQASSDMPYRQNFNDDDDLNEFIEDEMNEEERNERLVVRLVPKFIDYAIFLIQLTILGSYFYVAYFYEGLGATPCVADFNSDVPLARNASNSGVDVAKYFKIAIRWGFWMSLLTFIRAILAQVGLYLKRWVLLWCSYVLFAANISISIVLFILMQVWRWSHSGKVCSGDFLPEGIEPPTDVYLVFEGKFIKAILIAIYSIMGLSCLSIMVITVCHYTKQGEEEFDENGEPLKQTAFTRALDPDYEAAMRETARSEMKKKFFPAENQQQQAEITEENS